MDSVRAVGRDSTWVFLSSRGQMTLPVTLDPDGRYPDVDRANDAWRRP